MIILIVVASGIAWYRRSGFPVEDRFRIRFSLAIPSVKELLTIDKILTILIVISVIIVLFLVAYIISNPERGESYTEFYIFDENRNVENYPKNLTVGESGTLIVGISCNEYKETRYTVEIRLLNLTGERGNLTLRQYEVTLNHDKNHETEFIFNISQNGTYKMQFLLYIDNRQEPYRELHLWIDVRS